jgi:two-component system sensor histidine kinase KdpD
MPAEFALVSLLAQNAGRLMTRGAMASVNRSMTVDGPAGGLRALRVFVALGVVLVATWALHPIPGVNPTTAALCYLVLILFIATGWGIAESTVASIAAVLALNFFFFPPFGTFTISDPQNWVALAAFLVTAVVASQLSGRARQRHLEAVRRQRDLERLYAFSRTLLLWDGPGAVQTAIARGVAESFDVNAVALYDRRADVIALGGADDLPNVDTALRNAARQGVEIRERSGAVVTPITLGAAPIGSLALSSSRVDDTVRQSIVNLAAIGLERARSQELTARAEAARQSGELRATIMDALAHELKTPLTAATVAATDLAAGSDLPSRHRELIAIISEELQRLQNLVSDAVRMLRVDAGDFVVQRSRRLLREVVDAVLTRMRVRLDGHVVENQVDALLAIDADPQLLELAIGQLLDNAAKYSSAGSTIDIVGRAGHGVSVTVRNDGPPIPEEERHRLFDRFYRGPQSRHIPGTGLGLSIARRIAQAHGGTLTVDTDVAKGTAFTLTIPQAPDA